MVVRTQSLLGKDAPYVPGWDCHGLPIEWKVEEQYRKKKLNKDEVPVKEFRAECRAYAQHWVDVQREQLKRLGISANWDKPYLTMNFHAEATIVSELFKFAETGQLYRGAKPVMWSPVEKTALAEAEIEYEDIVSTQIDVAFEIVESPIPELIGAYAVIWTTTPWTIPVNQAIGYGPEIEYSLYAINPVFEAFDGEKDAFLALLRERVPLLKSPILIGQDLRTDFAERVKRALARVEMPEFGNPRVVEVLLDDVRLERPVTSKGDCRFRTRGHRRSPPDAQAGRLFRTTATVPCRRLRDHRPGHGARPRSAGSRRRGFLSLPAARDRSGIRGHG